ncbi:MAG TPA: DUF3108 domain-containing protein [Anaeromyxobacteraceae bacterium]|nr:DUF3108 domain-containing protein [Anaeromyxobacteraceae bacterium]
MTSTYPFALAATLALAAVPANAAIAPGEEMVLAVKYLNLHSGEGRLTVGEPQGDIWPVILQARTEGVAGFLDIREHLVSYWDATTRLPRGSDLKAVEIGDYHADSVRFDRANGKATLTTQRKGKTKTRTIEVPPDVMDLTSAALHLRLQPLAIGKRIEVPVATGKRVFKLTAQVVGREDVKTPAGTFASWRMLIRTTAKDGNFTSDRDMTLWMSDDPRRLIVRFEADFKIGSMVAQLKSYKPGNRVASAAR